MTRIRWYLHHVERVCKEWLSRWWRPRPGLQRGDPLPEDDHVLRYIGKKHVHDGIVNGSGFLSRPQESAPSVNWLEYFAPPLEHQVAQVRALKRLKYEKRGKLVRINVGHTKAYVAANATVPIDLFFAYDPVLEDTAKGYPADPSHAEIRGVPVENTPEGELIKDLLAECIIDYPSFSPDR